MKSICTRHGLLTALFAIPFVATVGPAHADAAGCKNPSWAPQPIASFDIDACTDKAWATVQVDLPEGSQTLAGHRTTAEYEQKPGAKDVSAKDAEAYQIALAQKAGAKLVSDPDSVYRAVLTRKGPDGEFWYIYDHGSGNDETTGSYTLTTLQVLPLKQEIQAKAIDAPITMTAKGCSNPPWLVKQFPNFKIRDCEKKNWDTAEYDLAVGSKKLAGKRLTVNYTLTDDKHSPAALAVRNNFVVALKSAGAKLMSDPNNTYQAIFTMAAPQRTFWIIYDHGNGNDDSTDSYSLTTFEIAPFEQIVQAHPLKAALDTQTKTCTAPPWLVKQFASFKVESCDNRDFDSVKLTLAEGEKIVAGRVLQTNYTLTDGERSPTAAFVRTNYVNALEKIGAKLMSDPNDGFDAVLMQKTGFGDIWYSYRHMSGNSEATGTYELTTIEVGGPPPKTCTLAIYGIHFDFDKSTLRPDSTPVLEQLLAMFKADPTYNGEIGGHTDNVGKAAYNMKLSAARADAVKAWLMAHGVSATRLTTHGYGDTKPLVPNTTDANRAKNRRVEMKRKNCK